MGSIRRNSVDGKIAIPRVKSRAIDISCRRTLHACLSCRAKRVKCGGQQPQCRLCIQLDQACTYTGSQRESQQLEIQSLKDKIGSYEALLREIYTQSRPETRQSIEDAFHKHVYASPETFAAFLVSKSLANHHVSVPKPGLSLTRMYLDWSFSNADETDSPLLCQKPPVQVTSIQFWTSLVDNDTASHLLSFYFVWENPTWQLVDPNMFVHDLENRRTRFCSSLLVHILLFFGCVWSFSYDLNVITRRLEEKALGQKLYAKIQCLWETEKHNADLPTLQSGILLGLLCCTFGIDRLGTRFIMEGAQLYRQLGLHRESAPYFLGDDKDDPNLISQCQRMVSWAIFDLQALAAQVYRKTPTWPEPPPDGVCLAALAKLDEGVEWRPYPFQTPVYRPHYYVVSVFRGELAAIVNEVAAFALKFPDTPMTREDWEHGFNLYQRLVNWKVALPPTALPERNTTPHVLCLQMYHQATVVSLCDIFNKNSTSMLDDPTRFDPMTITSQAMDTIGSLVLLFQHRHGWHSIPIVMLHYFCVAGVHSISQLDPAEPKWSLVLESCVVGLWHMSLGWGRLCKAFLRTIALILKANDPDPETVPERVDAILKHLDSGLWTATDVSSLAADYVVQVHHVPTAKETRNGAAEGAGSGSALSSQTLESLMRDMEHLSM